MASKDQTESTGEAAAAQAVELKDVGVTDDEVGADGEQVVPIIVGIGASAGGLEALKEMVAGLPLSSSLTYVIAQHLSPTHTSLLRELLKPETKLALRDIKDGIKPQPNTIYVTPPNQDVEVEAGCLRLVKPRASVGPKPSVDHLFQSLADNHGENTVGIILSGTGSDGAAGIRAIKAAGGITLVQDPSSAKYDGMPRAAIQTGSIDRVIPAPRIGEMLEAIVATPATMRLPAAEEESSGSYARVSAAVKRDTGFDIGHYKRTTVDRRLLRRMGLHKCKNLEEYAELVKQDPEEAQQLAKDILISVTSFFRDQSAFAALKTKVEELMRSRSAREVIRVWVAGCATGEEAYTIAMMFAEAAREMRGGTPEFLIFATDLDSDAVSFARNGVYPDTSVEGLPKVLRERYFDANGRVYQVKKNLRQSMVFAVQNVIEDPPFSRMDLISCRNLLIYLNRPVQRRVLEIFHYSLREHGYLFLGKSESIELHKELFEDVDKKARIFKRIEAMQSQYAVPLRSSNRGSEGHTMGERESFRASDSYTNTFRIVNALVEQYCPPAVVVNTNDEVIHFAGDLKPFLRFPKGPADLKVFELVHDSVRGELRALIHRARRENLLQVGHTFKVQSDDQERYFHCRVAPLQLEQKALVVVSFEPAISAMSAAERSGDGETGQRDSLIIDELERELANTRQHLQTVVEELETTNEELLSQSEELQSANEELQSTNEELQTSNEELQSTNEELMTVNDELQSKSHELTVIANDLQAVKESIDYPLLVVNDKLHITQFNKAANAVLPKEDLQPGMSVVSVDWHLPLVEILGKIREVTRSAEAIEVALSDERGRPYSVRIMPSASTDKSTTGAVLIFLDQSAQLAAEESQQERDALHRLVHEVSSVGTALVETDFAIRDCNSSLARCFGLTQKELESRKLPELFAQTDRSSIKSALEKLFSGESTSWSAELEGRHKSGAPVWMEFSAVAVMVGGKEVNQLLVLVNDVTALRLRQNELESDGYGERLIAGVSDINASDLPATDLADKVVDAAFAAVDAARVSMTLRGEDDELRVAACRHADGQSSIAGLHLAGKSSRVLLEALESERRKKRGKARQTFDTSVPLEDWLGGKLLPERLNLPLVDRGRVLGFFSIERPEGRPFSNDDKATLWSAADVIAGKLKEASR